MANQSSFFSSTKASFQSLPFIMFYCCFVHLLLANFLSSHSSLINIATLRWSPQIMLGLESAIATTTWVLGAFILEWFPLIANSRSATHPTSQETRALPYCSHQGILLVVSLAWKLSGIDLIAAFEIIQSIIHFLWFSPVSVLFVQSLNLFQCLRI